MLLFNKYNTQKNERKNIKIELNNNRPTTQTYEKNEIIGYKSKNNAKSINSQRYNNLNKNFFLF